MMVDFIQNSKGNDVLLYDGYLLTKNRNLINGNTYWECRDRRNNNNCMAKVTLSPNNDFISISEPHSHPADPEKVAVLRARSGMKRSAMTTNNSTQNILTANVAGLSPAAMAMLPNVETMRRDVRRNRSRDAVPVPADNDHLFMIPRMYQVDSNNQMFLQFDNGRQDRLLIFGTRAGLDFLQNSQHWFADGTFKVSPPQFKQLYTLHGLNNDFNVVGAYCLLPNKNANTYEEMLTEVRNLTNQAVPLSVMIDFESGMIAGFPRVYPGVPLVGCHFHLSLNIFKHIKELGLQNEYNNNAPFRENIRMMMAIAFVPVNDVVAAFNALCAVCGPTEQPMLDYFETNYIGELRRGRRLPPLFPHEMWNMNGRVLGNLPRTNNHLEGWHNRFRGTMNHAHPTIWKLISMLKDDASHNAMVMAQIVGGAAPPPQKRVYRAVTDRIRNLVQNYQLGNVIRFLRGVSYNLADQ